MSLLAFKTGLGLGFSLIMSIGAQNLFVIKQGLKRQKAYFTALICTLCDVALIGLSVSSIAKLLLHFPMLKAGMLWLAIVFLLVYGGLSVRNGFNNNPSELASADNKPSFMTWQQVLVLALSFSLLNPQALLDTVIMIGGSAVHYSGNAKYQFMLGAMIASVLWFFGLATLARCCHQYLQSKRLWQVVDVVSGLLMMNIAVVLYYLV